MDIKKIALKARKASAHLALLSKEAKNEILIRVIDSLKKYKSEILKANHKDLVFGRKKGLSQSTLDRITLNSDRIDAIIKDLLKVIELEDHVGKIIEDRVMRSGIHVKRVRVPMGVVGIIYEARPNVTSDAAALCLKSGNAVILKGGSDAINSNRAVYKAIKEAVPIDGAVNFIDSTDRKIVEEFLKLKNLIDVIIPRGGKGLIDFVTQNSMIPVIETGASVVHTYIDEFVDIKKAVKVIINAKLRRVSICNALDTLLLHKKIAEEFLKTFVKFLIKEDRRLEFRTDDFSFKILKKIAPLGSELTVKKSKPQDFDTEFLAPILAVKIVKNINEALNHIEKHSLRHSEAILTENKEHAEKFLKQVDAACVYSNASTQFSDGAEFGLGAEIGISTQKLHARGPFALEGLTTYKWVVEGDYSIRQP